MNRPLTRLKHCWWILQAQLMSYAGCDCVTELSGILKGEEYLWQPCLRGVDCNKPPVCTHSA